MTSFNRTLIISNKLGLHARAATKLAQLSQQFKAKITIELNEKQVDATSVIGLMLLAASQGKSVTVLTQGTDAKQALEAVCQLFCNKFDESE
jgi:phosphocarrier protein NPr